MTFCDALAEQVRQEWIDELRAEQYKDAFLYAQAIRDRSSYQAWRLWVRMKFRNRRIRRLT
ncbi:MAG: hypothetical protein E6R04_06790 [Spirochaetes bacterium]|nr:MAG: hypothetical protein E6R04_06790 [Spirochaetota bacterium]